MSEDMKNPCQAKVGTIQLRELQPVLRIVGPSLGGHGSLNKDPILAPTEVIGHL